MKGGAIGKPAGPLSVQAMKYVNAVTDLLKPLSSNILNATDYTAIAEWQKEGIPLELVERTISQLDHGAARDFSYINNHVRERFELWLRGQLDEINTNSAAYGG